MRHHFYGRGLQHSETVLSLKEQCKAIGLDNEILDLIDTGVLDRKMIWFSNEVYFWLSNQMNIQNGNIWEPFYPEFVSAKLLHQKVKIWAARCESDIIRPFYLSQQSKSMLMRQC
ncbi:hypothetical protein TNIN_323481 [Trichonephila inaurata madagascariensis]|uniref:Uncharacterized protein n=1 Tax=Trichonephila inaurata madagascariensis TaxID=2747483 RepID=A0A8X7BT17_9ARAC|nr:hypothetical protein TNIN_323481 [Trichonephila inaurata madagascariensis]